MRGESINQSIIIEQLEGVRQDRLDDTNLPPGVCDVATGIGTHEGWSGYEVNIEVQYGYTGMRVDLPEADGNVPGVHAVLHGMVLYFVQMLIMWSQYQ